METEFGGLFLEVGDAAGWSGQGLFEEEQRTWQSSTKSLSSKKGMNTLIDIPTSARLHNNDIIANKGTGQLLTHRRYRPSLNSSPSPPVHPL